MLRKLVVILSVLGLAFTILFISILRSAEIKYDFNPSFPTGKNLPDGQVSQIEYYLPYPGGVLPDNPLWEAKALRDRVWYLITTDQGKKADLLLLFADKRLNTAILLFEKREPEIGLITLSKAEKYLEAASLKEIENRKEGLDTTEFLVRLSTAALKHYEIIQNIVELAPDDARPLIYTYEDYAKKVYYNCRDALNEKGKTPPENPFSW